MSASSHITAASASVATLPATLASVAVVREGSLWAHKGLAETPPPRSRIVMYVLFIMSGYSVAMLVNSSASRFLLPRFSVVGNEDEDDPLTGVGLVTHVADPLFLLAFFRVVAAVLLCGLLKMTGDVPEVAPSMGDSALRTAFIVGVCNCAGYGPYLALTARGGVSVWSALVGLYVVGPVAYGVFAKGEARTRRKLVGVATCVIAGVLLGVSDDTKPEKTSLAWQNAALYFLSIGLWGICDGLASYVGRDLHVFYVAGAGGAGFAAVALVSAAVGYAMSTGAAVSTLTSTQNSAKSGLSQSNALALVALAQCAGVGAWFMSVKLGVLSECSSFLPITSLYTILASGVALLIFNEKPPPLYFFGMPLAAIGILCIAFGGGGEGSGQHKPLQEEAGENLKENSDTSRTANTLTSATPRLSMATARTSADEDDDW
jgi:drug/metabolite transporter (DMT)-like permease